MWPVGLSGGLKFEGPSCKDGSVTGWYAMWDKSRQFQVDMAGIISTCIIMYLVKRNPQFI